MATTLVVNVPGARLNHLAEADIAAYLDQHLAGADRERVEAHLESCAECRRAVADVRRLSDAYQSEAGRRERIAVRVRRRWSTLVPAGAALIAASLLLILAQGDRTADNSPVERSALSANVVEAISPLENAVIHSLPITFAWSPTDRTTFRIAVLDESGTPLWIHETSDTSVTLPDSIPLARGRAYFWRVDALAEGITASTIARRFTLAP